MTPPPFSIFFFQSLNIFLFLSQIYFVSFGFLGLLSKAILPSVVSCSCFSPFHMFSSKCHSFLSEISNLIYYRVMSVTSITRYNHVLQFPPISRRSFCCLFGSDLENCSARGFLNVVYMAFFNRMKY